MTSDPANPRPIVSLEGMIMMQLCDGQLDDVSGAYTFGGAWTVIQFLGSTASAYMTGIGAVGQTLSNYYGNDMTLDILNGGNLGA